MEYTYIGTLCIDQDLCITQFTPGAGVRFDLDADVIGRALPEVDLQLELDGLIETARRVHATHRALERRMHGTEGQTYHVGLSPIQTEEEIDGVAITFVERTGREAALPDPEETYAQHIIDTVWEPLLVLDDTLRVEAANPAFYSAFEVQPEAVVGELVYDLGNGQWDIPELRALLEEVLPHQATITHYDVEHTFEQIGWRMMRLNARRIDHKQCILLAIEDITEGQQMFHQLQEERNFVDRVLDTVGALVAVMDENGSLVRFNRECEEVTGYASEEVIGRNVFDLLIPEEERHGVHALFGQCEQDDERTFHENYWITKSGEWRLIRWSNTVLKNESEQVKYLIGTGIDITERRQLEREVISATDEERRRIGQDLHDMLASHLAGTAMMTQAFADRVERGQTVTAKELRRVVELLDEAGKQARSLSHSLMPLEVQGNELQAALRSLAKREEEMTGVRCTFEGDDALPTSGGDVPAHLYRIAAEAVNNALKHANPDAIAIRLVRDNERVVLTVRDDGMGISSPPDPTNGIGLHMMQYRADLIGARFDIEPVEGGGTLVRCSLPVSQLANDADA